MAFRSLLREQELIFFSLKAIEKLTHEDYETIASMIGLALDGVNKVKLFMDTTECKAFVREKASINTHFQAKSPIHNKSKITASLPCHFH